MIATLQYDQLVVEVHESNTALGQAAASTFAHVVQHAVQAQGEAAVILATGNSQRTFIEAIADHPEIPWDHITVFHMDEYIGMSTEHPASFYGFMHQRIAEVFHPKALFGIHGDAPNIDAELRRYTDLLLEHHPVITVMGIGENGHLAFNDPPADFHTPDLIHVVTLDEICRRQQVGEGHFHSLDEVPAQAMSLTIPALLKSQHVLTLVPEARKAEAVRAALLDPVSEYCPASILRTQAHVRLLLDPDSAGLLHYDQIEN
ncbi:MAG: glucosamine-6-phosphate deaminase [Anaerolineae bacterium]|nr:glucosamine-6-phosphate deaminase [Anaerolineae bacterium]